MTKSHTYNDLKGGSGIGSANVPFNDNKDEADNNNNRKEIISHYGLAIPSELVLDEKSV